METNSTDGSVAAPGPDGSGARGRSNRKTPCGPAPGLCAPAAGVLPEPAGPAGGTIARKGRRKHTTCNPFVNEALRILSEHGYETCKPTKREIPVEIVALKGDGIVKVAVIRSRKPVPDAKTLRSLFPARFREVCAFTRPKDFRTMIWIVSPVIGWRYYRADPGGVARDWDFTEEIGGKI